MTEVPITQKLVQSTDWFLYDKDLCHGRVKQITLVAEECLEPCQTFRMELFCGNSYSS